MRILVVEDDISLGEGLVTALRQHGYNSEWLKDGASASAALGTETFDAVILDLGLPRQDGIHVLQQARRRGVTTPIMVLTARDTLPDKLLGLDSGADDYLLKPFDLAELLARLRAIHRRAVGRAQPTLEHGELRLEPASHAVSLRGEAVLLSRTEYQLLLHLLEHSGRVVTRGSLDSLLYGWDQGVESNALEVHIHNLRRKLYKDLIRTIRGVGYMIPSPADKPAAG